MTILLLLGTTACAESDKNGMGAPVGPAAAPEAPPSTAQAGLWTTVAGTPPRTPADPQTLASALTVAEQTVRDPASPIELVRAAGWTAQVAYDALARHPQWDTPVLALIPVELHDAVHRNTIARRELLAMNTSTPPDTLPGWRIIDPLPPERLRELYDRAQARFGVPWQVLAAVNLVETGSGRIVGNSAAGAQGPMQFMPATWASYGLGGNVWDTADAIMGAANYLAANGGSGEVSNPRLDHALYRYNNDTRYVRAVREIAAVMHADARAFLGYHAWQIYYRTSAGNILLPTGYDQPGPIPAQDWLSARPR